MQTFLIFLGAVTSLLPCYAAWKSVRNEFYEFRALTFGLFFLYAIVIVEYSFSNALFLELCGIMAFFAWLIGSTYKAVCVIGNIYLQWGICLYFAFTPFILYLRKKEKRNSPLSKTLVLFSLLNIIAHTTILAIVWLYYINLPINQQFDQWYSDLIALSERTHLTYTDINLLIFVILFVLDLGWNLLLYWMTKRTQSITQPSSSLSKSLLH